MTKPISRKMAVDCILHRIPGYVNCGLCGVALRPGDDIEFDHIHAWVHGGPHAYQNLRPVHAHCHKAKTKADVQANAKVKRILADKPSKHPMKSRKTVWPKRKMGAGNVRREVSKV